MLSRRELIKAVLACGTIAGASTNHFGLSVARADGGATAAVLASIAIGQAIASFMTKSGSLTHELNAIHIKLDAILINQVLLLEAIGTLHTALRQLQDSVAAIPHDTVALFDVTRAQSVATEVNDSLRNYDRIGLDDPGVRSDYARLRKAVLTNAYNLAADAAQLKTPPTLVIGSMHSLASLACLEFFDRRAKLASKFETLSTADAVAQVRKCLAAMLAEGGIPNLLNKPTEGVHARLGEQAKLLAKGPFAPLWTSAMEIPRPVPPTSPLLDAHSVSAETTPVVIPPVTKTLTLCFQAPASKRPENERRSTTYVGPDGVALDSFYYDEVTTVPLMDVSYEIARYPTVGTYPVIIVTRAPPSQWGRRTWTSTHSIANVGGNRDRDLAKRDDPALLRACVATDSTAEPARSEWQLFQARIGDYNALSFLESLYQALIKRAEDLSVAAQLIEARLREQVA